MSIENKIKLAAFTTAFNNLLKGRKKSLERTARNILELSIQHPISEKEKNTLYNQILEFLRQDNLKALFELITKVFLS